MTSLYRDAQTRQSVRVLAQPASGIATIADVSPTGRLSNERQVDAAMLRTTPVDPHGEPWKTGYLPAKFRLDSDVTEEEMIDPTSLSSLTLGELMRYINENSARAAVFTERVNAAKKEVDRRKPKSGTMVRDGVFMNVSYAKRLSKKRVESSFDEETIKNEFSTLKLDTEKVKKYFEGDVDAYEELCDTGIRITVRPATPEDEEDV